MGCRRDVWLLEEPLVDGSFILDGWFNVHDFAFVRKFPGQKSRVHCVHSISSLFHVTLQDLAFTLPCLNYCLITYHLSNLIIFPSPILILQDFLSMSSSGCCNLHHLVSFLFCFFFPVYQGTTWSLWLPWCEPLVVLHFWLGNLLRAAAQRNVARFHHSTARPHLSRTPYLLTSFPKGTKPCKNHVFP